MMNAEKNLMVIGENAATVECLQTMQNNVSQMAMLMAAMADTIRANQAQLAELTKEVHGLTKATPAQIKALNARIRDRAAELCEAHRAAGGEKKAAAELRKYVKLSFGIGSMRELPRADWVNAMSAVDGWNDFRAMKKIRNEVRK